MAILLWKNAVTDRTQSDVERVLELLKKGWQSFSQEEKETWQNGLKGALNLSDLLRIQNNVSLLKEVLELDIEVFNLGKNLIPYPHSNTTHTTNGLTFTDNGDGTVTVNGTATAITYYALANWNDGDMVLDVGEYIFSGCPTGGGSNTYGLGSADHNNQNFVMDWGSTGRIAMTEKNGRGAYIVVYKGATLNNITFKPMLRLASIEDDTYESYSGRNLYVPTQEMYSELLGNIEAIRGAYCIHADTPPTPTAPLNTYQKWNDIEKILLDVYEILLNNFSYYCGNEIYAGDTSGLLL